MYSNFAIIVVAAYLLGSVPFGLLITKAHGKDLRSIGSGNIGATNVARALGRKWACFCFVLDVLKGLLPMLAAMICIARPAETAGATRFWLWLAVGCAAVLGHIFPIYLRFKGGKGVATSLGVALGLWPYFTVCAFIAFIVWVVVLVIWRYISLASITASIALPLALLCLILLRPNWQFTDLWPLLIIATAIALMVIIRHRTNISRLLAGMESKALKRKG